MPPLHKRVRYLAEYALLRAAVAGMAHAPYAIASRFVVGVADLTFRAIRRRRRIAIDNILRTGTAATEADAELLARRSFRHMGVTSLEFLRIAPLFDGPAWQRHVESNPFGELMPDLSNPERGLVAASGHFGSWELGGKVITRYRTFTAIARPLNNPHVERYLTALRFGDGIQNLPKHGHGPRQLLDVLRNKGAIAHMFDQHAGHHGIVADFLGQPASVHSSVARLPMATGASLWFAYCERTGPMRYACRAEGPIDCTRHGSRADTMRRIVVALNDGLAQAIHRAPEQYLWAHRRWRVQPHDPRV